MRNTKRLKHYESTPFSQSCFRRKMRCLLRDCIYGVRNCLEINYWMNHSSWSLAPLMKWRNLVAVILTYDTLVSRSQRRTMSQWVLMFQRHLEKKNSLEGEFKNNKVKPARVAPHPSPHMRNNNSVVCFMKRPFPVILSIWVVSSSTFTNLTATPCVLLIIKPFHYSKFSKQLDAASIWWHFKKMR